MNVNIPEIVEEIRAVFQRYETALVSNDVVTLNGLFWDSPFTIRYGQSENLCGIDEIRSFRHARPNIDLARDIAETVITTFGRDTAIACTLFRRRDSGRTGRQMQTWVRLPEGWRVVAAHVSFLDFDWPG